MGELHLLQSRLIDPASAFAGFTGRAGGVSPMPWESLNMGGTTDDDPANVAENRRRLCLWAGLRPDRLAVMGQVHGAVVRIADQPGQYAETDGLLTSEPGLMLGVLTADCIPLILYDPMHAAGGVIHCGWRPLVAGIAENAVALMGETWGSDPADIIAILGPGAGVCCYEIGGEVAGQLSTDAVIERDGMLFGDLKHELSSRLHMSGVRGDHIEVSPDCTICDDRYFSHRRDHGATGRMMGFFAIR